MNQPVLKIEIEGLKPIKQGKVRDIFDLGDKLLIVATDRISCFDVILPNGIPQKGYVLTQISKFWFENTADIIANHVISFELKDMPKLCQAHPEIFEGRSMLVKKSKPLPVECVVRGYLSGSGWNDYKKTGSICGIKLPAGLKESDKLPEPIFTPSTKAEIGTHDENINFEEVKKLIGEKKANKIKDATLGVYKKACKIAESKGIIIADTKFEFGEYNGEIILIDEVLTPDSSRFWPKDDYAPGRAQKSFDKQFTRDYLLTLDWDKTAPGPELPAEIIEKTSRKYLEALKRLTG